MLPRSSRLPLRWARVRGSAAEALPVPAGLLSKLLSTEATRRSGTGLAQHLEFRSWCPHQDSNLEPWD